MIAGFRFFKDRFLGVCENLKYYRKGMNNLMEGYTRIDQLNGKTSGTSGKREYAPPTRGKDGLG
ncbi:MAG TPA: hypothetical protein PKW59_13585 [Thermotogota bacterium]|nr:hypothetical protein [Thermotogota bacterium]